RWLAWPNLVAEHGPVGRIVIVTFSLRGRTVFLGVRRGPQSVGQGRTALATDVSKPHSRPRRARRSRTAPGGKVLIQRETGVIQRLPGPRQGGAEAGGVRVAGILIRAGVLGG